LQGRSATDFEIRAAAASSPLDIQTPNQPGFRVTHVLLERIAQRWKEFLRRGRSAQTAVVGIYGQPRGGTNFIAAALHYHPRLFAVNEHVFDYRVPLHSIWQHGSIYRADGRQDKRIEQTTAVVFNKMQEFFPELWNPRREFPDASRFLFYLRNPIRVHLSREAYRRKHKPERVEWTGTRENFLSLLTETQEILEAHEILKGRHPCLILTHEFFCCDHERMLPRLHEFLGVEPLPPANPRDFLRRCGRCGRALTTTDEAGQEWLICPRHQRPISGCGRFNPLTPLDLKGVLDDSWKTAPDIDRMMADMRRLLGNAVAEYFWNGHYAENLFAPRAESNAA
jgi:hypothetical protein